MYNMYARRAHHIIQYRGLTEIRKQIKASIQVATTTALL